VARRSAPSITIRSTFIAGFPGETEDDFDELLAFLEEAQLDRVGCFAYSPVDGAPANACPTRSGRSREERRRALHGHAGAHQRGAPRAQGRRHDSRCQVDHVDGEAAGARASTADARRSNGVVHIANVNGLACRRFRKR
jgi:ribosomal protein S12 methylthiotransferase